MDWSDRELMEVLGETASAIHLSLGDVADWGPSGVRDGQYVLDVAADEAGLNVLSAAGLAVLSEESAHHRAPDGRGRGSDGRGSDGRGADGRGLDGLVVVMDPVDGSTNASRGIPWFNTSLCVVDGEGPRVALVVDQVGGHRFEAARGGGARRNGVTISPSGCTTVGEAIIGLNGYPQRHLGWKQYRALGAAALDLCSVASGMLDGYVDCTSEGLGPWDYLAGLLICLEAGAAVASADGADLVTTAHADRRIPIAAATPQLLEELLAARGRTA